MTERAKAPDTPSGFGLPVDLRILRPLSPERVEHILGDRYTVTRELGAGGTSIVFLAHDHVRGHPVAVKVLRPELSVAVVAARFLREIDIGQRLAHPNVLPIYDYGSADGELYCVMPVVEGETLRQRLAREKQLSIEETLRIARAVAEALDYAHGLDVIHRDIKPANILLDRNRVIVADFGMARAMTAAASGDLTETGLVLGTAAYMSPEQANAERTLDGRSDVYSLACVVYEMLAGEPPFTGPTQQAIIARHSQEPPRSLRIIRPAVRASVQRAVEKALAKVPADRFATAGEFLDALEGSTPVSALGSRKNISLTVGNAIPWGAAGVAGLVALVAGTAWWRAARVPPPTPVRFTIDVPAGEAMSNAAIALSRDGRSVAFRTSGLRGQLYLRRLDQLEPVAHPKATGAYDLHFSPDGTSLLYTSGGGPTTVPTDSSEVNTEPKRLWSPSGNGWAGVGWMNSSNVLHIFADTLWRVPLDSGRPRQALAAMDATVDATWRQPVMLSDGKTVAIRVTLRSATSPNNDRLALVSIDGGARTLLDLESKGVLGYIDGVLIFASVDGRLMGVRFDLAQRRPLGAPVELVNAVDIEPSTGPLASVSDNGTLAYLVSTPRSLTQIADERGTVIQEISDSRLYYQTVWSPDGERIALYMVEKSQQYVGVYDVKNGSLTVLPGTTGAFYPIWTPDGSRIAFTGWAPRMRTGGRAMWVVPDGRSRPEPIPGTSSFGPTIVRSEFSPDGSYVVVRQELLPGQPRDKPRAFAIPLTGGQPFAIIHGAPGPDNPEISPNGKWIAYTTVDSAGQPARVYLEPFPSGSWRVRVSAELGIQPRWSRDGRTLFYFSRGKVRRATLDTSGAVPRVLRTDSLFYDPTFTERPIRSWDVHPDGKRFVLARSVGGGTKLVVVENWMTEVRAKLARQMK